jgi:hypothetical protein
MYVHKIVCNKKATRARLDIWEKLIGALAAVLCLFDNIVPDLNYSCCIMQPFCASVTKYLLGLRRSFDTVSQDRITQFTREVIQLLASWKLIMTSRDGCLIIVAINTSNFLQPHRYIKSWQNDIIPR